MHPHHKGSTQLAALIANMTVPPVSVRVEILGLSVPMLKVSISGKTAVVASSAGKIQRRRIKADGTPENVPMYEKLIMELAGHQGHVSRADVVELLHITPLCLSDLFHEF